MKKSYDNADEFIARSRSLRIIANPLSITTSPKTFSSEEFLLRIKAILRRTCNREPATPDVFANGEFSFDHQNYRLKRSSEEQKLTKKEAEILKLLCEHIDRVLERELIANLVWGDDSYFVGRSMDVFITKLRKYLRPDARAAITNIHGMGFKLEVKD